MSRRITSLGVTLVELLVAMSIIALLFTVGYANYRGYTGRQQFIGSLRKIEGDIRLTQSLASSGTKPAECTSLKGYRFAVNSGTISYLIVPVCENVAEVPSAVKMESLGADIASISTAGGTAGSVLFYVLGRGSDIDQAAGFQSFVITLTQVSTGKVGTITVKPGGGVSYSSN